MSDFGLTSAGFKARRGADFLEEIRGDFEAETGLSVDWSADTVLGQITLIMADRLASLSEQTQEVYDQRSLANATGVQLDALALLVGITRRAATSSVATLEVESDSAIPAGGVTIPEGSVIKDSDGNRWVTTDPVTITTTSTTDTVAIESEEAGPVSPDDLNTWTIVTPVSGWASANSATNLSQGQSRESDTALRRRRAASLSQGTSGTLAGIRAGLLALDYITAVSVLDNPTPTTVVESGITLDPHSLAVTLYPNPTDADRLEEVAETLLATTPVGIERMGDQSETLTLDNGQEVTLNWFAATTQAVTVAITGTVDDGFTPSAVAEDVEDAIEDYFGDLAVGDDIRFLRLYDRLADVEGLVSVTAFTLDGGTTDVSIDATTLGTLEPFSGSSSVTLS